MNNVFLQKLISYHSNNGYISFDGFNCYDLDNEWIEQNGVCSGWDGIDRRCQCGNRRVMWVCKDDTEIENVDNWYAEAY